MQKQTFRFWWSVPHHMPWSTLITVATSTHLSKSVSTDLTIQMGCKIGKCNKTSTPRNTFIMTPSLEGWPTKAKEELSCYEVILTLQGTNAVCQVFQYQMSNGNVNFNVKYFRCQEFLQYLHTYFVAPFYGGFQLPQGFKATARRQFTFHH